MNKDEFKEKLEEIRLSYISTMDSRREEIERYWSDLQTQWNLETFQQLYMIIHGIAGSAETFGFPEMTRQARSITNQFKLIKQTGPNEHTLSELDPKVGLLIEMMELAVKNQDID